MIKRIVIRNFRRLEDVSIDLEAQESVFVGPDNSGKTLATSIFRNLLASCNFSIFDFSVSKIKDVDSCGDARNVGGLLTIRQQRIGFVISCRAAACGHSPRPLSKQGHRNSHSLLFARFTCIAQGVAGIVAPADIICGARGMF